MTPTERNTRLKLVEDMNRIINNNCNPKPVGDKIWNGGLKLTTIQEVKEEEKSQFNIGDQSFSYKWIAF